MTARTSDAHKPSRLPAGSANIGDVRVWRGGPAGPSLVGDVRVAVLTSWARYQDVAGYTFLHAPAGGPMQPIRPYQVDWSTSGIKRDVPHDSEMRK